MFVNSHHLSIVVRFFHTMIFLRHLWMTVIKEKVFFGTPSCLSGDLQAGLELRFLETCLIPYLPLQTPQRGDGSTEKDAIDPVLTSA
ncbi:MAG: hypothetical protein WBH57_12540 [Anaerolineae bacterium]